MIELFKKDVSLGRNGESLKRKSKSSKGHVFSFSNFIIIIIL